MAATQVWSFTAVIPAGTPKSAPVTIDMSWPEGIAEEIDITVPPGPSGLVGFQLWVLGGQVLPTNTGGWIVADDRKIPWRLDQLPDSGAWQLRGYNTDIYDHSIYVEFQVVPAGVALAAAAAGVADSATAAVMNIGGG